MTKKTHSLPQAVHCLVFNERVLIRKSDIENVLNPPEECVFLEDPDWYLAEEHLLKVAAMIQEQVEVEP